MRVKLKSARSYERVGVNDEQLSHRQPSQQLQQTVNERLRRQQLMQELQDQIDLHRQEVISQHEISMQEIENQPISYEGDSVIHVLENVRQSSSRRQHNDADILNRCQCHLQKLLELKQHFRQLEIDRSERMSLREKRRHIQSSLKIVLDLTLQLRDEYSRRMHEYLDCISQMVQQHISIAIAEQELHRSVRDEIQNFDIREAMKNLILSNATQQYRQSSGCVRMAVASSSDKTMLCADFDDEDLLLIEGNCCAICLVEYNAGDEILRNAANDSPLQCHHYFHKLCISEWIKISQKISCPCCRYPFISDSTKLI